VNRERCPVPIVKLEIRFLESAGLCPGGAVSFQTINTMLASRPKVSSR
jgi:hypothetical protein